MIPARSVLLLATLFILPGCATIVGGSKYNAGVIVKGHPQAEITGGWLLMLLQARSENQL